MLMALRSRTRLTSGLLVILLSTALLLQGYRYPLRINSSNTSPTYSDTPIWLQMGKWGVIAALAAALVASQAPGFLTAIRAFTVTQKVLLGLQALVLGVSVSLVVRHVPTPEPALMALMAAVGLSVTVLAARRQTSGQVLVIALVLYGVAALAFDALQVTLYVLVGRLPALAYADSPSVRFGSILDDPNGFAIILAPVIAASWCYLSRHPAARTVLVVGLLCCLPLTQSWTGTASTSLALVLVWALLRGLRRDVRRAAGGIVALVLVVATAAFFAKDTLAQLVHLKQGSAADHERSLNYILPGKGASTLSTARTPSRAADSPTTIDAGLPSASAHLKASASASVSAQTPVPAVAPIHHATAAWTGGIEAADVNLFVNYGALLLVAYLATGIIAVVLLLRRSTGLPLALRAATAAYLISYLLATVNLGLDRTFPCNLLYFVFCGLSASGIARRRDRVPPGGRRGSLWQAGPGTARAKHVERLSGAGGAPVADRPLGETPSLLR